MNAECVSIGSDTDGNGKIGLEDAVPVLQVTAGINR